MGGVGGVNSLCSNVCAQKGLNEGQIGQGRQGLTDRDSHHRPAHLPSAALPFDRGLF